MPTMLLDRQQRREAMKTQDKYIEVQTFSFPGMVARVYRPVLTEEERTRRMQAIHDQAANFLRKV
jgi:hypothetical protein